MKKRKSFLLIAVSIEYGCREYAVKYYGKKSQLIHDYYFRTLVRNESAYELITDENALRKISKDYKNKVDAYIHHHEESDSYLIIYGNPNIVIEGLCDPWYGLDD
jgi:hypothetical protein